MDKTEYCSHCGAKMVEHKHGLSRGLVRSLAKMAKRCRPGQSIHINDIGMNHNEQANFQKLRYFNIIQKDPDHTGKGGWWTLTQTGWDFITGVIALPKFVRTFRGEVVERAAERIWVGDVTGGWKYRPDYARDARPHDDHQGSLPI